jgi:hypothetical protein
MSVVEAYVDSYEPVVNYSTSLMDLNDTSIQFDGPLAHFTP